MTLQATKKLQDFLGLKMTELPDKEEAFLCWHANLVMIERRKCLLLTHNESLYTLFLFGVTKKELPTLSSRIKENLREQLRRDDFTPLEITAMLETLEPLHYAKTSDRSVTGNMNDMLHRIEHIMAYHETTDAHFLASKINATPYKRGKHYFPAKILKRLLAERLG